MTHRTTFLIYRNACYVKANQIHLMELNVMIIQDMGFGGVLLSIACTIMVWLQYVWILQCTQGRVAYLAM